MFYSVAIRDYISNVPLGKIITTREVLHLGTRCAVDMTLCRMVKASELIRVAWGAFVRAGSEKPSALAVIQAKAQAFGRTIASHGEALAQEFGLLPARESLPTFCISAGSTSFLVMDMEKKFVSTCDRKRHFADTSRGRAIRALWNLGKEGFLSLSDERLKQLQNSMHVKLSPEAAWMPAWMSDRFIRST